MKGEFNPTALGKLTKFLANLRLLATVVGALLHRASKFTLRMQEANLLSSSDCERGYLPFSLTKMHKSHSNGVTR